MGPVRKPRLSPRRLLLLGILLAALGLGGWWAGRQLWALHHFRAAEGALAARRFADARTHLDICLQVWPHSQQARLLAARAARCAGLREEAEQHFRALQQQ